MDGKAGSIDDLVGCGGKKMAERMMIVARFEPERPFFAMTGKGTEPFSALNADHPLYDMTGKDAVALQILEDGTAELSAAQEYLATILSAQDYKSKKQRGVPLLYAGAVMLRFSEDGLRINAPALLIPVRLQRPNGREPARVRLCFDDAEPNGPLFDLLRRRFDFEPEWPPHLREGMDGVNAAFLALKRAVRPGWGVYDEIALSLFDLSEWHLYADADSRAEQIAQHPLAGALAANTPYFTPALPAEKEEEEPLALPLFADCAQRNAVRTVALEHSLLLSGKGGTGKTTTGANAALNALFCGKTVLYAARSSEKRKAYFDLVESGGAKGFCLNLDEGLTDPEKESKPVLTESFMAAARRLNRLRARCDALASPATALRSCGLRFFELAEACAAFEGAPDAIAFSEEEAARIRRDTFVHLRDLCGQLANAGRAVGHPANHPLAEIRQKFHSKTVEDEVPALLETATALAQEAGSAAALLCAQWNLPKPVQRGEFEQLCAMAGAAAQWEKLPHQWLQAEDMTAFLAKVKELISKGKRVSETRTRLLCTFAEPALAADVDALAAQWAEAEKSLVTRATVQSRLFKEIAAMLRHGVRVERKQVPGLLAAISAYQKELSALQRLLPELSGLLNSFWRDVYTDWIKVEGYYRTAQSVNDALLKALGSQQACAALYRRAAESGDLSAAKQFESAWKRLQEIRDKLFDLLDVEDGFDAGETPYPLALAEAFARWNGSKDQLKDWMNWRLDREKAIDAGLSAVVEAYEKGLPHEELLPAFERGLYVALARHAFERDAELRDFSAQTANAMLDGLCSLDEKVKKGAKQAVAGALWEQAPEFSPEDAPYSEQGMFQKALLEPDPSLFRMFERMPGLMPRRFPLVVASLSQAARLPKSAVFDLVIVDDANALNAREAQGLLARGKTCLIIDRGAEQEGSLAERLRAMGMPEMTLEFEYAKLEEENAWSDVLRLSVRHTESAIFAALSGALENAGWQCRFFPDQSGMLVMNKNRPVSPLFSVMTDGPELKELSLSDRELNRFQPLRRAERRVFRFWYAQWWKDREGVLQSLMELARAAQQKADLEAARKKEAHTAEKPKQQPIAAIVAFSKEATPSAEESGAGEKRQGIKMAKTAPEGGKFQPRPYVQAELSQEPLAPQDIFDPGRTMLLKAKLADAILQEAPISKTLLVKRVLSACGIKRAGARLAKAVGALAEELDFPQTRDKDTGETFFWSHAEPPEAFFAYRSVSPGQHRRDALEIPRQEAANAVCAALSGCGAVQDIQLAREAAYLMGFMRLGVALEQAMLRGISEAHRRGDVTAGDGVRYRLAKQLQTQEG
jgi:hypothetical protein